MSDLLDPIPEDEFSDFKESVADPFDENVIQAKSSVVVQKFDKADFTVSIDKELPHLDMIDALPGVAEYLSEQELTPKQLQKKRQLTLRSMNDEVTDFTNDINIERMDMEEKGEFHPSEFIYDVEKVRLLGQYGSTGVEMAAYFGVEPAVISRLLKDDKSHFHKGAFLQLSSAI